MTASTNLVRWLLARSDVEAALYLLDVAGDLRSPEEARIRAYIEQYWPAMFSPETYDAVYEEAGKVEAQVDLRSVYHSVRDSPRFRKTVETLKRHIYAKVGDDPYVLRILDFGCSRGIWAAALHNFIGGNWTLHDLDQVSIAQAKIATRTFAGRMVDNTIFSSGKGLKKHASDKPYDVILAFEVLEHVLEPNALIQDLESRLAPGGLMFLSLPYGPFEYQMWLSQPNRKREHLREFSFECIMEMFGSRDQLEVQYIHYGPSAALPQMSLGHWLVTWRKTEGNLLTPLPNLARKTALRLTPFISLPGL